MSNPFPTQLSDLYHPDPTTTPTLYHTLKHLRKSTLSLHNRLHSILIDSLYITSTIQASFPNLPLIANERCGSWYIPPTQKSGSAYFKSTDGHYGYWDFSLRRLNLQVLELVGMNGGAVLVDSTRRGKRMPDALRRTVPVWTVVWNRVLFEGLLGGADGGRWDWAFRLQHPGLEPGEVRLIEARVDAWMAGLRGLDLHLSALKEKVGKPIRLCWVVQGEDVPDFRAGDAGENEGTGALRRDEYNLLVLCSASRPVPGAEMSEDGYVQGAADDAEGWSGGLTSAVFWEHKNELMSTSDEELLGLISRLTEEGKNVSGKIEAVQIQPAQNLFVAAATQSTLDGSQTSGFDLVVECNGKATTESSRTVTLGCRSAKMGSKDLRQKLSLAVECTSEVLTKNADSKILIICENGKDLSIGVAVALLCLLYADTGNLLTSRMSAIDKQLVKKRLAWITTNKPDANPSRSTLQAVHSFLM